MKKQNKRKPYDTDLSDSQWEIITPFIPPPRKIGKPRSVDIREVINAIFYVLKSGCPWRLLPNDFPKWQLVYYYFRSWKKQEIWKTIHDQLRGQVRVKEGRNEDPSAGIIDSQSVKTAKKGGLVAMTLARR